MTPRALIGLGSNLGDRNAILDGAVATLRTFPGINLVAVSRYHETLPVGGPSGQGPFLNAAAVLEPNFDPFALLGVLQEVEARFGRERTVRWGERTLDLDLLLHGDAVLETPELRLPHPRFPFRRFALAPAAEVAPGMVDPLTERTVAELVASLDRRPSLVCLDVPRTASLRPPPGLVPRILNQLVERLGAIAVHREALGTSRRLPGHPLKAYYLRIRSLAERLSELTSPSVQPDRWRVVDVSLEQEMLRGMHQSVAAAIRNRHRRTDSRFLRYVRDRATAAVRRAPRPTLVVLLGERRGNRDRGLSTPVLIPDAQDPEGIAAEIAIACEATRS